jgi:hypothetical protein
VRIFIYPAALLEMKYTSTSPMPSLLKKRQNIEQAAQHMMSDSTMP